MWNQILFITLLQFFYVSSRTIIIEPDVEEPLIWLDRFNSIIGESLLRHHEDDIYKKLTTSGIKEKRTFLSSLKSLSEKRALSMFARWGPINSIGKDRNPIRSGYPPRIADSVSTQTRSRILGQPLRWG